MMYQPYEINDFISDYCAKHDKPDIGFILMLGPYLACNAENNYGLIKSLTPLYPSLQYMVSVEKMREMWRNDITYREYREMALKLNKEFYQMNYRDTSWAEYFTFFINGQFRLIQEYRKNHPATESAITNFAGIGNTMQGEMIRTVDVSTSMRRVYYKNAYRYANDFLAKGYDFAMIAKEMLQRRVEDILTANRNFYLGTWHDPQLLGFIENAAFTVRPQENFITEVSLYYFMAGCVFYGANPDWVKNFIALRAPTEDRIANESLISMATAFESDMVDSIEALEAEYLDDAQMKEQSDKQVASMLKDLKAPMHEQTHKIDLMMNYIRTHREIKCDQFTNQMFLQESGDIPLTRYTIQDEAMIAILDDGTLVCPYTDIVDEWKLRLLCMDNVNTIYIIDGLNYSSKEGE